MPRNAAWGEIEKSLCKQWRDLGVTQEEIARMANRLKVTEVSFLPQDLELEAMRLYWQELETEKKQLAKLSKKDWFDKKR